MKCWFTFAACGVKPHYRRNRFSESDLDQTVKRTDNKAAEASLENLGEKTCKGWRNATEPGMIIFF